MVTLLDVLKDTSVILDYADDFGFKDVRIHREPDSTVLQLLVKAKEGEKQYVAPFEALLMDRLNLHIYVLQEEALKTIYKAATLEEAAPIDDVDAIEKLFGRKISDITIDIAPADAGSKNARARAISLAQRILVAKHKPGVTQTPITFFTEIKEEKISQESVAQINVKRKADELVKTIETKDFEKVLQTLPDDTFDKLEKQIHEAKKVRVLGIESNEVTIAPPMLKGH
jgi:hypothetical protein